MAGRGHRVYGNFFYKYIPVIPLVIYGVLVIAAIQGSLGGLAFWMLGMASPLMWGAVMFLLSMIPVIGSTIVWIPTALPGLTSAGTALRSDGVTVVLRALLPTRRPTEDEVLDTLIRRVGEDSGRR